MKTRMGDGSLNFTSKALVAGRIGLVKMLGREKVPVTLVREFGAVPEKFSKYCREFIQIPNLTENEYQAIEILIKYGQKQDYKPVVFMNGESDVMLFSKFRDKLEPYYQIELADHELLMDLINKDRFAGLSERFDLPTPKTYTPKLTGEFLDFADNLGYPCILKPIRQRLWHKPEIIDAFGMAKAIIIRQKSDLKRLLDIIPYHDGNTMIQQYIHGDDQQLYDFHTYIDKKGVVRGSVVGHKLRTYPVQFGCGCYTHYVDEPEIEEFCLENLKKIGYTGVANINVKRDFKSGRLFLLEINPRYSLWSILDSKSGINLALMQYCELTGNEYPYINSPKMPSRWLYFGNDLKAMLQYRKRGQISILDWIYSFFKYKGKIEFHLFSLDDPMPFFGNVCIKCSRFIKRVKDFILRQLKLAEKVA